jgi:hypothetical protein
VVLSRVFLGGNAMTRSIQHITTMLSFVFHTTTLSFAAGLALLSCVLCLRWLGLDTPIGPGLSAAALSSGAAGGALLSLLD